MKRGILIGTISVIAVLVIIGAVLLFTMRPAANSSQLSQQNNLAPTNQNSASQETINPNASSQNTSTASSPVKEFNMTAQRFQFNPSTIQVNLGDTVILHITSQDTTHGFAIPEFGVSQQLPPGQTETVQFVADKKGTFTFFCNVYCGSGHSGMSGSLTVN